MNLHAGLDRLVTAIGGLYGDGAKFFGAGTTAPHVTEIISRLDLSFVPPDGPDEVRCAVSDGTIGSTARYQVIHADDVPEETLIYHHGSGETDYTARIFRIMRYLSPRPRRVIAVSVPDNETMRSYLAATRDLHHWTFLLASSVRVTEALVAWVRGVDADGGRPSGEAERVSGEVGSVSGEAGRSTGEAKGASGEAGRPPLATGRDPREVARDGGHRIVCAGISLGGWITNLHHACFDSCDAYRPIFAGAAPDHLFTDTIYRKMLARSAGPDAVGAIHRAINFEDAFAKRSNGNVVACMARHDQFVRLERQGRIYRPANVTVLEKGHITGAMAYRELAAHLST